MVHLDDCHAIHLSIDDSLRRVANQALFEKLIVIPGDDIDRKPDEPLGFVLTLTPENLAVGSFEFDYWNIAKWNRTEEA